MSDFQVRSDAVDVEQIMEQIRRRIRDKRGVDYTEAQVRELASVRLEKFLDPKNLRSDLLEQFRKSRPADDAELPPPTYEFEDTTLYDTHRGLLRTIRRWLNPVLKLFFNPNTIVNVLHQQANLNRHFVETTTQARVDRAAWNALYYEVLHNLVLETTRASVELKNLKMRVEALSSRLDFSERRVRALEGVVQYRPEAVAPRGAPERAGRDRWRRRGVGWRAGAGGGGTRGRADSTATAGGAGGADGDVVAPAWVRRPAVPAADGPDGDSGREAGAVEGDDGDDADDRAEERPAAAEAAPASPPPSDVDPLS